MAWEIIMNIRFLITNQPKFITDPQIICSLYGLFKTICSLYDPNQCVSSRNFAMYWPMYRSVFGPLRLDANNPFYDTRSNVIIIFLFVYYEQIVVKFSSEHFTEIILLT